MIKKEILLNPIVRRMDNVAEPPISNTITMNDLSMDEANQYLSPTDRLKWVDEQIDKDLYFVNPQGYIQMVEPKGWWY